MRSYILDCSKQRSLSILYNWFRCLAKVKSVFSSLLLFYFLFLKRSEDSNPIKQDGQKAVINHSGRIFFVPEQNYNFRCNMDLTNFPFDVQTCKADIGSWVHHMQEVSVLYYLLFTSYRSLYFYSVYGLFTFLLQKTNA